jgi:hypothetical protein
MQVGAGGGRRVLGGRDAADVLSGLGEEIRQL